MKKYCIVITLFLLSSMACCAVADSLTLYLKKVKYQAMQPTEPIPPPDVLPKFLYPKNDNNSSPFAPKVREFTHDSAAGKISQEEGKAKNSPPPFLNKSASGDRISLNFQDIKVRVALHLLADFTGIDLVVSDKVTGKITLHLNDIPWDQALDIILTTRSLSKRKIGNVLFIAPAEEILEREKKEFNAQIDLKRFSPTSL